MQRKSSALARELRERVLRRLGERLWRKGFRYAKCGVMITELLTRNPPAAGTLGRAGPREKGTGMEGDGQAHATLGRDIIRVLGAGPEKRRLQVKSGVSLTSMDDQMK